MQNKASIRVTVSSCGHCFGAGVVPIGVDPNRVAAIKDEAGQVIFAAIVAPALHYGQCPMCLGSGAWQMNSEARDG